MRGMRRALRIAGHALRVALAVLLGLALLLSLALYSLRFAPLQALVLPRTNAALAELFRGRLEIQRLGPASFGGVRGLDARLLDPEGRTVVEVRGANVDVFWPSILWRALVSRPKLFTIELRQIAIEHAHVRLLQDGTDTLSLTRAFESKTPEAPKESVTRTLVRIRAAELRHAWVDGELGTFPLDAELEHARAALEIAPERFELDAASGIELRALPGGVDPKGRLTLKLGLPSAKASQAAPPILAKVSFRGKLLGAGSELRFELHDKTVQGTLEAPSVGEDSLATLLPGLKLRNPLALGARVLGTLPNVDFALHAGNADGRVRADGNLHVSEDLALSARLSASAIDLSGFVAHLPQTALTFEVDTRLGKSPKGLLSGDYRARSLELAIAGVSYPGVRASGTFSGTATQGVDARGTLSIDEPGVNTLVRHDLSRLGTQAGKLTLEVRAKVQDPPRFSKFFSGIGEISGDAVIWSGPGRIEARTSGRLARIRSSGLRVARLELAGKAAGELVNPRLSARLEGSELRIFERKLERVVVTLEGVRDAVALAAHVDAEKPARVELHTRLSLGPELVFSDPRAAVQDGPDFRLELGAARIALGAKRYELDRFALTGAGSALASLVATDRLRELELSTSALALSEILSHLGLEQRASIGRVDLEARYADGDEPSGPIGTLSGALYAVRYEGIERGRVRADIALSNRTATGTLEAAVDGGGTLFLSAQELRIPERLEQGFSADKLDGALRATGRFDLSQLEPLLTSFLPVAGTHGTVDLDARLDRTRGSRLVLRIAGRELGAVVQQEPSAGVNPASPRPKDPAPTPFRVEGLELDGDAELDLRTWAVQANANVGDRHGVLLTAQATATPEGASPGLLAEAPLSVQVSLPPRGFDQLPSLLPPSSIRGVIALDLELAGTLRAPRLRAHGAVNCLRSFSTKASVDLELDGSYAREGGQLDVRAHVDQRALGKLDSHWEGDLAKLTSPYGPSPVRADLALNLQGFPVEVLPLAARHDLNGPLSGKVELRGLGRDAQLFVELKSDALGIGPLSEQPLELSLSTENGRLVGLLALGEPGSHARAELASPLNWADRLLPSLEPELEGRFQAQNFELGTLLPWVAADVSELAGTVNADLTARISEAQPIVEGTLSIERGVVQVPAIGQRFSAVEAKVSAGRGDLRLESFSARGTTGKLEATGRAELEGFSVKSAEGRVEIERDDKIPVTVQGSAIGYAWGKLHAKLDPAQNERETHVHVDVPELHVELPSKTPAALQDLAPAAAVRAGTRLPQGNFVALPIEPPRGAATRAPNGPATTRVDVNLGRQVWIERGDQLEVQVGGKLQLTPGAPAPVQGTIELREGILDVRGKRFQIERGSVSFAGPDPSNPTITALARWDSPEGYTVTAEYSGTARQGKLSLHSEPSLTDNEILTLLLFGSPEGSAGVQSGFAGKTALGLASGSVVQSFNHVLSSLTNLDVSARIDTSTGASRPEISVQLSPRLTARVTFAVGDPTAGQAPDRTFLTVDLRLLRAWSLSTMVGDKGASALDLIWRKRY